MFAAIDGDVLVYQCGFASDAAAKAGGFTHEPFGFCKHGLKLSIQAMLRKVEADDYVIFLTGSSDRESTLPFREERYSDYKKNRDSSHKPYWYKEIKEHLIADYHAILVTDGLEADDYLGEAASLPHTIVCSKDKDLDMVPGLHYNWSKTKEHKGVYRVTEEDGWRFFLEQMLTGDSTDNIPGIYRMFGRKATAKVLSNIPTDPKAGWDYVSEQYENDTTLLQRNADLLWIRRKVDEDFQKFYSENIAFGFVPVAQLD